MGVSTLFTECQNSTPFRRYDQFNFRGLDFYIGNRGVIFGNFFTIFAYKIVNIDVESTKIVTKMQTMNRITQKILKMKIFENLVKIGHISTKNALFYKNAIYSK